MNDEFAAEVRPSGGLAVVSLHGVIDRTAADAFNEAFDEAAETAEIILLDFGDVGYINSTGIAVIVGVLARARTSSKTVRACNLSDHYREIFNITRLADFVTIYDDEMAALAARQGVKTE